MTTIENISVQSISCAVPKQHFSILEYAPNLLDEKTAKRMSKKTGFTSLRVAPDNMTTADLVACAAEPILHDIDRSDIKALVFVSQTPDHIVPATSHILQDRLGLSNETLCIDVQEGCSGYVTGLFLSAMLAKQFDGAVLLAAGDTSTKISSNPNDRATRCIFGDAGTVSLIAPTDGGGLMRFAFEGYGDRFDAIIRDNSAGRRVHNPRNDGYTHMDGVAIMDFSLDEVPACIEKFLADNQLSKDDVSLYACHQANKLILRSLADKLGVPHDKMPFTSGDIGNESSASIPLVLTHCADSDRLERVLCCGFGVGLAIAVCLTDFSNTKFYGVFELE